MKIKGFASLFALLLLITASWQTTNAQTAGQSASGTYQYALEDGYTKYVEFDAHTLSDGSTTGSMTLTDEAEVSYQDVDGTGDPVLKEAYKGFYLKAEFDGLVVNKNQAIMSGVVRDSNVRDFIGKRVLLTVEDNGENTKEPDKLTWGIYQPMEKGWTPSDAELKEDAGVGLRWMATDAERKDDAGVLYPKKDEAVSTQSFPAAAYSFIEVERAAGDIKVSQ